MDPERRSSSIKRGNSSSKIVATGRTGEGKFVRDKVDDLSEGKPEQAKDKATQAASQTGRVKRPDSSDRVRKDTTANTSGAVRTSSTVQRRSRGRDSSVERRRGVSGDSTRNRRSGDFTKSAPGETSSEKDVSGMKRKSSSSMQNSPRGGSSSEKSTKSSSAGTQSPRGPAGGVMSLTKSFEAKTSMIRRRDSDGSLLKTAQKVTTQVVPFRRSDSVDRTKPATSQKTVQKNSKVDNGSDTGHRPILDMALHKSSSDKSVQPQTQNGQSEPGSEPASPRKDLKLDLSMVDDMDDINETPSPKETAAKSDLARKSSFERKSMPRSEDAPSSPRKVIRDRKESPRGSLRDVPASPRDGTKKPVLEKKLSSRSMASPRSIQSSPRDTKSESGIPSRRPPLEKKPSSRSLASPRDLSASSDSVGITRKNSLERKASTRSLPSPRESVTSGKETRQDMSEKPEKAMFTLGESSGSLSPRKPVPDKRSPRPALDTDTGMSPRTGKPPIERKVSTKNLKGVELKRQSSYEQINVYGLVSSGLLGCVDSSTAVDSGDSGCKGLNRQESNSGVDLDQLLSDFQRKNDRSIQVYLIFKNIKV